MALIISLLVLAIMLGVTATITSIAVREQRISKNTEKSLKSYYAAEAAIEDSLYRIISGKRYDAINVLDIDEGTVNINITGGENVKTVAAVADIGGAVKKVSATISIGAVNIAFHYGAQIDKGGLSAGNNATIFGNVYSNGNISGVNGAKITGDAWVAGSVSGTPDQEWLARDADFEFGLRQAGIYYIDAAQSFVPSATKIINKASIYLKKVGSPPDITVRIVADNDGKPAKSSLGSGTLRASLVTANYSWTDVSFDPSPTLNAGATYWIVIDTARDDTNYWVWGRDSNDGYGLGTGKYTDDWTKNNAVWENVAGDLDFRTWMGGDSPTFIEGFTVQIDAHANTIRAASVGRDAYYQNIDEETVVVGQKYPETADPATKDMPVSYAQIQEWESAAVAGGIITPADGTYVPDLDSTLGPIKIEGNLAFPGSSYDNPVIITGPVWVTGKISASNSAKIKIKDDSSIGFSLIGDNPSDQAGGGKIELSNNVITEDNSLGGRLLFVSTNTSLDDGDPAISLYNNVNAGNPQSIVFSLNGKIMVSNNAEFSQITGYAVRLDNNSQIVYEEGLINANFSSGPGGGWEITSWRESE
ncbi:MAG: pilus assembly PilX N-terminal domain-containing protein [bacterium]